METMLQQAKEELFQFKEIKWLLVDKMEDQIHLQLEDAQEYKQQIIFLKLVKIFSGEVPQAQQEDTVYIQPLACDDLFKYSRYHNYHQLTKNKSL